MQPALLVTGGAGFIGSNFARYFLQTVPDARLIILDKLTYAGNLENLRDISANERYTFIHGDICDPTVVAGAMRSCNWVINFAAETHVDRSLLDASEFIRTDVEGTFVLLEAARKQGISRFIQISTDEVYGNAEAPDGDSRPSLETDTLKPLSPYAASKAGADRLAFSYWASYGLPVVITRCSNNYGPYQYPEKQLPLFIINALAGRPLPIYGDGRNTRDWIHVHDHSAALLSILQAPPERVLGEVFNIGSGEERSILDNARFIVKHLGLSESLIAFVPDRPGHVRRHAVDTTKLKESLGWAPTIPFEAGIAETIAWYRSHDDWLQHILTRYDAFLNQAMSLGAYPA